MFGMSTRMQGAAWSILLMLAALWIYYHTRLSR